MSSTGALSLKQVPKDLIMIGGGVIGLELVGLIYKSIEFGFRFLKKIKKQQRKGFGLVEIGRERHVRRVLAAHRRSRHRHGGVESVPEDFEQTGNQIPTRNQSDRC